MGPPAAATGSRGRADQAAPATGLSGLRVPAWGESLGPPCACGSCGRGAGRPGRAFQGRTDPDD